MSKLNGFWVGLLVVFTSGVTFAQPHSQGFTFVTEDIVTFDMTGRTASVPHPWNAVTDEDCRAKISQLVCLVNQGGNSHPLDRACLPESTQYVKSFQDLYDRYPAYLQKMFCSLKKIFVEKNLVSTAYASSSAPIIGIRASLLDEKITFSNWATWKEQLSFGGDLFSYVTSATLPTYDASKDEFLYDVMAHEFGHLFDFANSLNEQQGSQMKPGSWGAISWTNFIKPKPAYDFTNRNRICFYDCNGHFLPASAIPQLYEDIATKTNFLNTYTSRNPYEDFADTFGFYVAFDTLPLEYSLDTRAGKTYDFRQELKSDRMKAKVDFIKGFIGNAEILYP